MTISPIADGLEKLLKHETLHDKQTENHTYTKLHKYTKYKKLQATVA